MSDVIPATRRSEKFSLPAMGFILAAIILAVLLGVVTWRNLDREERLMEDFLQQEGLTLIRAFEAGTRTSMMMDWRDNSLATLVRETARSESLAYVAIADASGRLVLEAGNGRPDGDLLPVAQVLAAKGALTRQTSDGAGRLVFEVAREFNPIRVGGMDRGMMNRWRNWCGEGCSPGEQAGQQVVFVGLYTRQFEAARQEDVRRSLLMGGFLLLLGSAGFYFLFLSQQARVARTTLANMELYTRNVIDSMPAGLITLDTGGRIVSLNARARDLFGKREEPVAGQPLETLTGSQPCEIAPLVRDGREFVEQPMECHRSDGEVLPVKVSASRLKDREGEPLGTVLIVRDMREVREMEEALERSRRHAALGRMAAGIAHEIRNPLGTLRGFAQYFSSLADKDPRAEEYAGLMISEVDRLNRIISALLQYARPRRPEAEDVDLGELLQRTARLLQDDLRSDGRSFELLPPPAPVCFRADPDLLTQVLINLLQNAAAATEPGGAIRLAGEAREAEVHLRVEDSGRGMTPEEQAQMFDPFFTTRKTGTGLGLAMVHQIVEQHGGRIEVESAPGQGTRVLVVLPREGSGAEMKEQG